jgi:hypothetical protein
MSEDCREAVPDFEDLNQVKVLHRPRLLSDNGPSFVSSELGEWLESGRAGSTDRTHAAVV